MPILKPSQIFRFYLDDLYDTDVASPINNYVLVYNSTSLKWEAISNVTLGTIGSDEITVADGYGINLQEYINFTGATGVNLIKMPDNLLDALSIQEGSNKYVTFDTVDDEEDIFFYKSVDILHTSTHADDHALEIDADAAGYGDVKALDIDYITGNITAGEDEGILLINVDRTLATGGDIFALEVLATDQVSGSTGIYGLKIGPEIGPVHQDSGTFIDSTLATDNTPTTHVSIMADGILANTTAIFTNNSEYIIIGADAAFQDIELVFSTAASKNIRPTFWYSIAGEDNFTQFTPVDGTDGCKHTGVISWDDSDVSNHVADDITTKFDIKIIRTKGGNMTTPVLGYAKTASTTEYVWDESGNVNINDLTVNSIIGSLTMAQNSDTIVLSHDGSNAYFKWSDGDLGLVTDEGTNTDTHVSILGKGTGVGLLEVYDTDEDSYIILGWKADDEPSITCDATPTEFNLLHDRPINLKCWSSISSGNPYFEIWGKGTAALEYLRMRVESDNDALIEAEHDLNIIAGGGAISFGNENLSTTGTLGSGELTVDSGAGCSMIIKGTSTGNANLGWIGFYDSDGTTRRGYIGDGNSGDDDIYIGADTGYLRLLAAGYISLGTHTYFPDNVVMSFGASLDYSIGYYSTDRELQIVNGSTLDSNVRLKLDLSGHFDFGAGNLTTTGTIRWSEFVHDVTTDYNLFLGKNAGASIEDGGQYNICIGEEAGLALDTGDRNVIIGYQAGKLFEDGHSNIAIGYEAFIANVSGFSNVAIGRGALKRSTGSLCVAIGHNALVNLLGGGYNTAIGSEAGFSLTSGQRNFCLGRSTGKNNETGNDNIYIGHQAGEGVADQSHSNNVFIGKESGISITTGGGTVAIGYGTGHSLAAGNRCVFIGYEAGYNNIMSNRLYIANSNTATPLIYGDFTSKNIGLSTATFGTNAENSLGIAIGVEPATSIAGQIEIYAKDSSDGATNATLAFRTEQSVEAVGTFTASHKHKIWINGVEYWIQLDAV